MPLLSPGDSLRWLGARFAGEDGRAAGSRRLMGVTWKVGPEREVADERVQWRSDLPAGSTTEEEIEDFKHGVLAKLTLAVGKDASHATDRDWFVATTLTLLDRVIHRWLQVGRD